MTCTGSTTLPRVLLILRPFSSLTCRHAEFNEPHAALGMLTNAGEDEHLTPAHHAHAGLMQRTDGR